MTVFGKKIKLIYSTKPDELGLAGYFLPQTYEIHISKNLSKEDQLHTLCHELFHSLVHRLGWNQSIHSHLEEAMAESLATFLLENFEIKVKDK